MECILLDEKDCSKLRRAIAAGREIRIVKTLGGRTEEARTLPAGPVWDVDMLVQVRTLERNVEMMQNFATAEAFWAWTRG